MHAACATILNEIVGLGAYKSVLAQQNAGPFASFHLQLAGLIMCDVYLVVGSDSIERQVPI